MAPKPIQVPPDSYYTSDLGLSPDQEDPGTPPTLQQLGSSPKPPVFPKINSSMPHSIMGDEVPPGEQIPDTEMKGADKAFKQDQKVQGQQTFHNNLRDFGQKDADIRGQIISLDPHDPDYLKKLGNLHTAQGAIQEEKAHYEKGHPWGTMESAHPGVFGKIGHVLGEIGSVAAPAIAEEIPGSQPNLSRQEAEGQEQQKQGANLATAEERAQAAGTTAGAHELTAQTHAKTEPIKAEAVDRATTVKENDLKNQLGEAVQAGDHEKAQQILDMLKQEKAAAKPVGMQHVPGMVDGKPAFGNFHPDTGKYTDPVSEAEIPNFVPAPNATQDPHALFVVPTPEGGQKLQNLKPGQTVTSGAVTPPQFEKQEAAVRGTQNAVSGFTRYQNSFHSRRGLLTPNDIEAMKVLTSHATQNGIAAGLLEASQGGVLDALVGQPMTGYSQKLMQGTMAADQYEKLSPAGKKMLADYFHAIVGNFVNMKQRMGGIGRNESMIQAEMNAIPMPFIDVEAADQMLQDTIQDASGGSPRPLANQPTAPTNRRVIDLTK